MKKRHFSGSDREKKVRAPETGTRKVSKKGSPAVAQSGQSVEELAQRGAAVLAALAPDAVHFPPDLFKAVKSAGVFGEGVVGVVLDAQIG